MKKIQLILLAISLSASVQARVLTLNNNTPSPGQYTTFSSAYAAALSGDTILVQESPDEYGALSLSTSNKSLTVIGAGHKPGTTAGYGCQFSYINISSIGNSVIRIFGLQILSPSGGAINQSNTTIEKCYFSGGAFSVTAGNILIRSCIFYRCYIVSNNNNAVTGLTITNNIFETSNSGYCFISMNGTGSKVISNNLFVGVDGTSRQLIATGSSFRNTIISNNIFYGVSPRGGGTHTGLLFSNNLTFGSYDDNIPVGATGSGNLIGVDPKFANVPVPSVLPTYNYSYDYRLKSDSPGKGAGTGGSDLGLYPSTGKEFSMRGEPDRPFTTQLLPGNPVIASGSSTNVNFTIRQGDPDLGSTTFTAPVCRAKTSATEFRNFMCYNLGAAFTGVDPSTPAWEINGGYWQWGRSTMAAAGPSGIDPNSGGVTGWLTTSAANGSWTDASKTSSDPCPAGFRVPTRTQWEAVLANNSISGVGSWTSGTSNYTSGRAIGTELFLPAAGYRSTSSGALISRNSIGVYWSSTETTTATLAWYLTFDSSTIVTGSTNTAYARAAGLSVRCIAQ